MIKQIEEYDQELESINQEHLRRLEVIEALSLNYESIFYVDLDQNRVQPYRISDRIEYQFRKNIQTCEFIGFASEYIKQWVHPLDHEIFLKANTPEYIRERLSNTETFHSNADYGRISYCPDNPKHGRPFFVQYSHYCSICQYI